MGFKGESLVQTPPECYVIVLWCSAFVWFMGECDHFYLSYKSLSVFHSTSFLILLYKHVVIMCE